jgi:hypothetical protein
MGHTKTEKQKLNYGLFVSQRNLTLNLIAERRFKLS